MYMYFFNICINIWYSVDFFCKSLVFKVLSFFGKIIDDVESIVKINQFVMSIKYFNLINIF